MSRWKLKSGMPVRHRNRLAYILCTINCLLAGDGECRCRICGGESHGAWCGVGRWLRV